GDLPHQIQIPELSAERAIQIDDMQSRGSSLLEGPCKRDRVVGVHGALVALATRQAHDAPLQQINGGDDFKGQCVYSSLGSLMQPWIHMGFGGQKVGRADEEL